LDNEYSIPRSLQPDPKRFDFDLSVALSSVIKVKTQVPDSALTASVLGTEREGHGVVIDSNGLVLTIGYLVTEAESVWLIDAEGRPIPAHVVAYDQETGFGLVRGLREIESGVLALGESAQVSKSQRMILAGAGGVASSLEVSVVGIREFAGYWEYLLDQAFFTRPAHPSWGGAALIGEDGKLYGIGSLILQSSNTDNDSNSANMVIPIDLLKPIMDDLLSDGQRNAPPRPWLGWYVQETSIGLIVVGVVEDGPAHQAGIRREDKITEINGVSTISLPDLYRAVWASGHAGVLINVAFKRDTQRMNSQVSSIDRQSILSRGRLH